MPNKAKDNTVISDARRQHRDGCVPEQVRDDVYSQQYIEQANRDIAGKDRGQAARSTDPSTCTLVPPDA